VFFYSLALRLGELDFWLHHDERKTLCGKDPPL